MMIGRSWKKGEINNAERNNGRTEREVHKNARGVEQKEARMRRQQVRRQME